MLRLLNGGMCGLRSVCVIIMLGGGEVHRGHWQEHGLGWEALVGLPFSLLT